ncbi:MAG: terminase family protein [Gammaproteobacteria bacterium]|nr:terminase family protein [Gammaproteobacteria bacterium]
MDSDELRGVLADAPRAFREMLPYLWRELWMRPDQDPLWDQDWLVRLMLGGRGAGKTRSAAEAIREAATTGIVKPGQGVGLVGRTYDEAVNIMVQGPSGVLNVGHPSQRPSFVKATGELKWPNGVTGLVLSAEAPSSLRGHQFRIVWCDEPAAWSRLESVGDQNPWRVLQMAVREQGEGSARILATTTPRATMWMRRLAKLPTTLMTAVPTSINIANLDARQVASWYAEYAGSRWADQELEAQILDETEGAWFRREWFQSGRRDPHPVRDTPAVWVNEMPRQLVVGVDPQGGGESMCGIIVCAETVDGELQVWDDMSIHGSPAEWADQVILCCEKWHTREVALEKEYGNKMGRDLLLRSPGGEHLNIHLVSSGGQGKALRAEPVAARFQKKQARMRGGFRDLEEQCCIWTEEDKTSPDRMDAMVHAMRHLDPSLAGPAIPEAGWSAHSELGPSRWRIT